MKILWCDVETTGCRWGYHEIVQISGIVEINGERKKIFDIKMRPNHPDRAEQGALDKCGVTIEQLKAYPPRKEGFKKLLAVLDEFVDRYDRDDKFVIAGYNVNFDRRFLDELFQENNDPYIGSWFWYEAIDVLTFVMAMKMAGKYTGENLKLETVCREFGMPFKDGTAHNAVYDIAMTLKLFYKVQKYIEINEV